LTVLKVRWLLLRSSINLIYILDPKESAGDASQSGTVLNSEGQDDFVSATEDKDDKPKVRRPRYSNRRHQSKSEPTSHMHESMDGTHDSDMTVISSGDGQPLVISTDQVVSS
jgi:hypothetical protein